MNFVYYCIIVFIQFDLLCILCIWDYWILLFLPALNACIFEQLYSRRNVKHSEIHFDALPACEQISPNLTFDKSVKLFTKKLYFTDETNTQIHCLDNHC